MVSAAKPTDTVVLCETFDFWKKMRPAASHEQPKKPPRRRRFPVPHPFVKWVGGKRFLIPEISAHIAKYMPGGFGTYHEPFVGGGALFFHLKPERAVISDNNERLVRTYRGIRDQLEDVILNLDAIDNDKETFLQIRAMQVDDLEYDAEVAAWFIYLNKTGFNGLYRVNRKNIFNVPYGKNPNATVCDVENLRACSEALAETTIGEGDFTTVLDQAQPGDFVYFDPPYAPLTETSNFTSYTRDKFAAVDQERLRNVALDLKRSGVHVLLSNSDAPLVHDLYAEGFESREVLVPRNVNSVASKRGKVPELLIW
jgi:DNA adenine methylase